MLRLQLISLVSLAIFTSIANGQDKPILDNPDSRETTAVPSKDELYTEAEVTPRNPPKDDDRVVGADEVMIAWSEKMDELRGFSSKTGEWETLKVQPQKKIEPVVSNTIAFVRLNGSIAGFSSTKCCWDVIELPQGFKADPIVYNNVITILTPDHLYTFASEKGRWTSPTDMELKSVTENLEVNEKGMERLRRIEGEFWQWLESLPKYQARGIALIIRSEGSAELSTTRLSLMKLAKSKLFELGYISDSKNNSSRRPANEPTESKSTESTEGTLATASIEALKDQYTVLEAELDSLLKAENSSGSSTNQSKLRSLAEQSFDLRQRILRSEADRLQAKLRSLEESLSNREKRREEVVSRRLAELDSRSIKKDPIRTEESQPKPTKSTSPAINQASSGGYFEQVTFIAQTLRNLRKQALEIPDLKDKLGPSHPLLRIKSKELDVVMKAWKQAWSSYTQQIQLLELSVQKKKIERASSREALDTLQRMYEKGAANRSELAKAEQKVEHAEIELREAEQIVGLFRKLAEDEPELNPEHEATK